MRYLLLCVAVLLFASGFVFATALHQTETRTPLGGKSSSAISEDRILDSMIHLYKDKLVVAAEGLMYAKVEDTKSMEPLLSKNSHTIEVQPIIEDMKPGDIISFYEPSVSKIIVHYIVEIGYDEYGWYAITKGYNNDFVDDWKVRFENVKGVVVGILN